MEYKLNHFTMTDAQALMGKVCDLTEWDLNDDDMTRKITYRNAAVSGLWPQRSALVIAFTEAVFTDAATGKVHCTRPGESEWIVGFASICEVTMFRNGQAGA